MYLEIDYEDGNSDLEMPRIWRSSESAGDARRKNGDRIGTLCVILFQTS